MVAYFTVHLRHDLRQVGPMMTSQPALDLPFLIGLILIMLMGYSKWFVIHVDSLLITIFYSLYTEGAIMEFCASWRIINLSPIISRVYSTGMKSL